MTEVMTCSSECENFSYSKHEFDQEQPQKESSVMVSNDIEDESTESLNCKVDTSCDKSSESTICGSDDSVATRLSAKDVIDNSVDDSANSTIRSDTSCEDYEYLTTETTVISTTSDISQPAVPELKVLTDDQKSSTETVKDNSENKRVVVQIIKSDPKDSLKSGGIFENKSINEHQSSHSFRDDVCKLLTKSRPALDYGSDTVEDSDFKDVTNGAKCSVQRVSSAANSLIQRQRRNSLNPYRLPEKGPKLGEIKYVYKSLKATSAGALRVIHFLLYDKYGLCSTEMQIARTRRRILRFSGYPFDKTSKYYRKRFKSLLKIPFPMLLEIHEAIFGRGVSFGRIKMANNLMKVFLDTEKYNEIMKIVQTKVKLIPEKEYINLKERAKSGPLPVIRLEKLDLGEFIEPFRCKKKSVQKMEVEEESQQRMEVQNTSSHNKAVQNESNREMENNDTSNKPASDAYALPAYILKGPGRKLKNFPSIVKNIKYAEEKELNLLHRLLYGRVESIDVCRRNILEFSGFLDCQHEFISDVQDTLKRLDKADMREICRILCLRARTNSRKLKIKKIMVYLKAPFNPALIKGVRRKVIIKDGSQSKLGSSKPSTPATPFEIWEEPENAECSEGGYKLRDFRRICTNIECSAPSDLTELNDLLFMKPSDDTDIHDKILNFTRFGFTDSSIHYHYRKTLMFYMGPCIVRKIAKLLNIENWDSVSSHEDLAVCILNFLMEKKDPDSTYLKPSVSSSSSKLSSCNTMPNQPLPSSNSFPVEAPQEEKTAIITSHRENVFISRVSTSSLITGLDNQDHEYIFTKSEKRYEPCSSVMEDDSVPLRDFIHHPTDQELRSDIDAIVKNGLFSITLGDVVNKVYHLYPRFNLAYREDFIKSETRKIVSELRQNAVEHMKQSSTT